jgi:hypothetical protein
MNKIVEDIMDSLPPSAFRSEGKFVPKLNFAERCEILAFYRRGISRVTLAAAFGVDRRTITHIYTVNSPHYKNIREEEKRMGREDFVRTYTTESGARKIALVQEQVKIQPDPNQPVRSANKFRGLNLVKTEYTNFEHRVMIEWFDGAIGEGWYYKDLDGPDSDDIMRHNGPESIRTSQECLRAVKDNLFDV